MLEPNDGRDQENNTSLSPADRELSRPSRFEGPKNIDVELTNACNTTCTFCPRDKTPRRGLMADATFDAVLFRVKELDKTPDVHLCGLGEPLLHPRAPDFVRKLAENGVATGLTTNGQLLSKDMAKRLVDAGLSRLMVSASGTGQLYEEIHKLHFETIKRNVENFRDIAESQTGSNACQIIIQMVATAQVFPHIEDDKNFWRELGIGRINVFKMSNRGGAVELGEQHQYSQRFRSQAEALLVKHNIDPLCAVPFVFVFIGWNGNYYMCCHDYEKLHPLSTVFDYGILEINEIKKEFLLTDFAVCRRCDMDKANVVSRNLATIEQGLSTTSELDEVLKRQAAQSAEFPVSSIDFADETKRVFAKVLWEEEKRNCA